MTTKELLLTAWDRSPLLPLVCVLAIAIYVNHFRARARDRGGFFVLGVTLLFLALASPIGVLARGYLFSAHMLQHLLLMLAIPPLLLLSLPRLREPAPTEGPRAGATFGAWLAGVGGMWFWHVPLLCNAAATSTSVQAVQTISLLALGLLFWRPVLSPHLAQRMPAFPTMVYLFSACAGCTVLGIVVTFSPVEVCRAYANPIDTIGALPLLREGWGMSCNVDQQIGGLMMWVPTCFVYGAAMLATLSRYYGEEKAPIHTRHAETTE